MVYCGKPSKGCAPCRSKRTKVSYFPVKCRHVVFLHCLSQCDLGVPSCSQCVRTGRVCTGYRAEAFGEFRDQSREVTLKHSGLHRAQVGSSIESKTTSALSQSHLPEALVLSLGPYSSQSPSTGYEDAAAWFFFKDYVLSESTVARPIFNDLPRLFNDASKTSALPHIISALGLASISIALKQPGAMLKAHAQYAKALNSINGALRDPKLAKEDQTLLVVMLLGLYEEVSFLGFICIV